MYDNRLAQAKLLLDFYFAPWGAAKGEIWEDVSGDQEFSAFNVTRWVQGILDGHTSFDAKQVELLKIVTSPEEKEGG